MTPAENAGNLPALFASARPATKLRLLWYVLGYGLRRLGLPPLYRGGVFEFRFGRFEVRTGRGDLGTIGEIYINHTYDLAGFQPRPGDVCLDIGANIGCVAVQWYSQDATGRIIAVEPHPITAAQLRRNLDLNGAAEVEVIQAAAGRECGEVTLIVDAGAGSMGRTLGADVRNLSPWESERAVRVPSITVDSIVKSHALGRIDLLKIDVEGYEIECLEGARGSLPRTSRVIVEQHGPDLRARCREILQMEGFAVSESGTLLLGRRGGRLDGRPV